MEPLIFYFAGFSIMGLLLMGLAYIAEAIRPTEQKTVNGRQEMVPRYNYLMKIGEYLFGVFFLAMSLQTQVDFAMTAPDLLTGAIMVSIAIAIMVILLLTDLIVVFAKIMEWINKGR